MLSDLFSAMMPKIIPKTKYQLQFTEDTSEKKLDLINVKFTLHDVICHVFCLILGTLYLYNKVFILFLIYNTYYIIIN